MLRVQYTVVDGFGSNESVTDRYESLTDMGEQTNCVLKQQCG